MQTNIFPSFNILYTAATVAAAYHVGDTPMDVQAALSAGAFALGVCTGVYARDDLLQAASPGDAARLKVFDDLTDTAAFIEEVTRRRLEAVN